MNATIRTARFLLRKFEESDLRNVFSGLSHPEVIKYYGVSFSTPEETLEQMKWYTDLEETGAGRWWAICSAENSEFLGAAGFNNLSKTHRKAELGFWLLPENWGKGIIQETIPQVLEYGFKDLNLHRVEALVETGNSNSAKALLKLGFEKEGLMKDCEIKNGRFISLEIFAMLKNK